MARTASFVAALLLSISLAEAKTNYKKWLDEEVVWIISQAERAAFRTLHGDEAREEFIRKFWQRRDPTPETPRNECREEHYRRYKHALEQFQEGTPGWKTDRGRVYILHGAPDKEDFLASSARLRVTTGDSRKTPEERVDDRSRIPNTIIWTYQRLPDAKYYRGALNLVFQPTGGLSRQSFVLGESKVAQEKADELNRQFGPASDQNWLEADVRYQLIVAGPPDRVNVRGAELPSAGLGEAARYVEDLLRSPGEILEERSRDAEAKAKSRQQLREAVTSKLSFGSLPIGVSRRSYLMSPSKYRVQVEIEAPWADLRSAAKGIEKPRIELYCSLVAPDGRIADELSDRLDAPVDELSGEAEKLRYLSSLAAEPGSYVLKTALRVGSERLGYREESVQLDKLGPEKLKLSEILVTNRLQTEGSASEAGAGDAHEGVTIDALRLLPTPESALGAEEAIFVYVQMLLPAGRKFEDSELSVGMSFMAEGAIVRRIDARKVESAASSIDGVVNFATRLPPGSLEPGSYTVQVQAIEHRSRQYAIQRGALRIR